MIKKILFFSSFFIILISCSTQKNTTLTRAYHNLTAHYNVFFNGKMALLEAKKKIEQNCQINYFNLIPVFPYECPNAKSIATSKLNRTLEKSAKVISNHSIKAKPVFRNSNLTPSQIAFLKKKEYNKWIDDSYLLIGIANLYKQDLNKSQRAFHKILDDFKDENTRFDAQLWLIKTYILQESFLDAKSNLQELEKKPQLPKRLYKEIYLTWTDLYINMKQYDKAIPYLEKGIKLIKNRQEKAKYTFLLAQLYLLENNREQASKLFKKVSRYNPPYELEFHAKLLRATTLSSEQNTRNIKRKLLKMLKDEKNEDYKDKIYYSLAQIYLKEKDTSQALQYFRLGANLSQDNLNKALIYKQIAKLYFETEKFILSGAYYDSTLQYLPKNYENYEKIKSQTSSLIELSKNFQIIQTKDSLLKLASLPQKKLYAIIDSIINAKKREQEQSNFNTGYDPFDIESQRYAAGMQTRQSQSGKWYFYNTNLISRGQQLFKQRWGNRKLEDNWRRKNKNIINENLDNQQIAENEQNPENTREFYLKQIPFSDSAKKITKEQIIEAWLNIAQIFEYKLQNYKKAKQIYNELLRDYPQNKYVPDIYYHLFLISKQEKNLQLSEKYKNLLISHYPKSRYSIILLSGENLSQIKNKQIKAENLLLNTIKLYNSYDYYKVIDSANYALKNYSFLTIIPNIIFLKAKAYGNLGMMDSLLYNLNYLIENYPQAPITTQAKKLYKEITQGNLNISVFKFNPQSIHYLVVFTTTKDNVNQLKFNLFKLVNEYYSNKTFQINIVPFNNYRLLVVRQFDNLAMANNFLNYLYKNQMFRTKQMLLFSEDNFNTFTNDKNLFKYQLFYSKYYKF